MSGPEWATVIAAVAAAIVSILTVALQYGNNQRLSDVHQLVNGASEKINELSTATGHAQGVADEQLRAAGKPPAI
jgi:hypothetical protein